MIRKQTWILLAIFAVLVALAIYLQRNPVASPVDLTPSPTSQSVMLSGWVSSEIVWIEYKDNLGSSIQLEETQSQNWQMQPDGVPIDLGKVEEIRTQILDASVLAILDPGFNLDTVGLVNPTGMLTISNAQGKQTTIKIGDLTPTESGYYVIVDSEAPKVVSRYAIEAFLELLQKNSLLSYTPTPEITSTIEETPEP